MAQPPPRNKPPWPPATSARGGFSPLERGPLFISRSSAKLSIGSKKAPGPSGKQGCGSSALSPGQLASLPNTFPPRGFSWLPHGVFSHRCVRQGPNIPLWGQVLLFLESLFGLVSKPTGGQESQGKHRRQANLPSETGPHLPNTDQHPHLRGAIPTAQHLRGLLRFL